jgi:hypothetical protein
MAADTAGEGRSDAGMVEVELGIADCGQSVVDGGLSSALLGCLLICGLDRTGTCLLQRVCAEELAVGEVETGVAALDLSQGLAQLDLVRGRINLEEQIALADDVTILETNLCQSTTDLGAQLDRLDGGELT